MNSQPASSNARTERLADDSIRVVWDDGTWHVVRPSDGAQSTAYAMALAARNGAPIMSTGQIEVGSGDPSWYPPHARFLVTDPSGN